ncbi:protein of unknown function (plasmid) [Shinella sp. WSC3-e]|nr:hypothetical protein SHINE37_100177 [Rhizobiaceae bacterium]CAI0335798.1 hypothetical protein SHINE37_20007 [Rhizobiaceae bacterium]CAK7261724.1 protein of unknown function [Shinella sp. WSC3-e]CAK7262376.1 protein of unknown function [Shinella sp. WSC3-e]
MTALMHGESGRIRIIFVGEPTVPQRRPPTCAALLTAIGRPHENGMIGLVHRGARLTTRQHLVNGRRRLRRRPNWN